MKGDLIVLEATVGGIFKVNLILDTGAEYNLFLKKYLFDLMSIPYGRILTVRGADRKTEMLAYTSAPVELSLGKQSIKTEFLVLKESYFDIESSMGIPIEGVLGINFFKDYLLEVNYSKKKIHLYPKANALWNPGDKYEEIPLERERNKLFASLEVKRSGGRPHSLTLLLDSGAAMSLLLFSESDSLLAKEPFSLQPSIIGLGLGGYLNGYEGSLSEIKWGPFQLGSSRFYLQEKDTLYLESDRDRRNGILGNRLLSQFNFFLDTENNRIFLAPGKKFNKGISRDLTGLLVLSGGPYFNQYFVGYVFPGSPAENSNFQAGDRILAINGIPSRWYSLEGIQRIFRKGKGRKLKITTERNKIRQILLLERRDYIGN